MEVRAPERGGPLARLPVLDAGFIDRVERVTLGLGALATLYLVQTLQPGLIGGFAAGVVLAVAVLRGCERLVGDAMHVWAASEAGALVAGQGLWGAVGAVGLARLGTIWLVKLLGIFVWVWLLVGRANLWAGALAAGLTLGPAVIVLKVAGILLTMDLARRGAVTR